MSAQWQCGLEFIILDRKKFVLINTTNQYFTQR